MFGDDLFPERGTNIRVCCGPRCGAEPGHRGIYAAVETVASEKDFGTVLPAMCQGLCGLGVTVAMPGGEKIKLRTPSEARVRIVL